MIDADVSIRIVCAGWVAMVTEASLPSYPGLTDPNSSIFSLRLLPWRRFKPST